MKEYKRLTERRGNLIIDKCANCENVNNPQWCTDKICYEFMKSRLCELEDKIENGTLIELNSISKLLNEWFGSPCDFIFNDEHVAEYMFKKYGSWCDENCVNLTEDNALCWEMYLKAKLKELKGEV